MSRCRYCGSTWLSQDPMGALWCQGCGRVNFPTSNQESEE